MRRFLWWLREIVVFSAVLCIIGYTFSQSKWERPRIVHSTTIPDPAPIPPHNGVPGLLIDTSEAKPIWEASTPDLQRVRRLPPVN